MAERGVGPGRVLLWVYGVFVVAAGSRSAMQLVLHAERAPVAYGLSAVAAVVYTVGFVLVLRAERGADPRPAMLCCVVELAGVVVVGTLSVLVPSAFPDATVWSGFGIGYGLVPLALPVFALWWLGRLSSPDARTPARTSRAT